MSLQRLENLNLRMIEKHFPHLHNAVNNLARAIFVLIPISILCLIYRICFIIRYLNLDPYQKIDLNRHQNTIKKFLTSHNLWNSFDCPQAIKMSLNGLSPNWFPDWKLVWKRLGLINCLVRFVTVMQGVPALPLLLKQWQNHETVSHELLRTFSIDERNNTACPGGIVKAKSCLKPDLHVAVSYVFFFLVFHHFMIMMNKILTYQLQKKK